MNHKKKLLLIGLQRHTLPIKLQKLRCDKIRTKRQKGNKKYGYEKGFVTSNIWFSALHNMP